MLTGAWSWLPPLVLGLPLVFSAGLANAAAAVSPSALARKLIELTPASAHASLILPFTDEARSDWHYVPRRRAGVPFRDMSAEQRDATLRLLKSALTDAGIDKIRALIALEVALRELETFGPTRDPGNYAIAIFGAPQPGAHWGWRLEGHHLSLHFTLEGERYIATLPQFMGANPACVPRDFKDGPKQGTRVLGVEEDAVRALVAGMSDAQRAELVFEKRTYGDILSKNAARLSPLEPVGIAFAKLAPAEQAALIKVVTAFADHLQPELAQARLVRVRAGGLDTIRIGWAGSLTPGQPHYFRIQGARFLIEWDNSGGNHVHSVWRDFAGDWGRDILREHYQKAPASGHSHGH
jgi:hypothetical protein